MFRRLHQFEGLRCSWRLVVAGLLYVFVPLFFIAASVLAAYIAGNDFKLETAILAAVVVGVSGIVGPRLARRRFHRQLIASRLWSYERPNPQTGVEVLVQRPDVEAAQSALRRARFNPSAYTARLGSPPSDAPDLNQKIGVTEPEAWPQSESDEDRTRRMVAALESAGIRARVGGVDTSPA